MNGYVCDNCNALTSSAVAPPAGCSSCGKDDATWTPVCGHCDGTGTLETRNARTGAVFARVCHFCAVLALALLGGCALDRFDGYNFDAPSKVADAGSPRGVEIDAGAGDAGTITQDAAWIQELSDSSVTTDNSEASSPDLDARTISADGGDPTSSADAATATISDGSISDVDASSADAGGDAAAADSGVVHQCTFGLVWCVYACMPPHTGGCP